MAYSGYKIQAKVESNSRSLSLSASTVDPESRRVGKSSTCTAANHSFFLSLPPPPHMASSCQNLIAALKDCLMQSDCVMKQGNLPSDCLRHHADELPEECQSLRKATFECKRGMVCNPSICHYNFSLLTVLIHKLDMRKRMRGNIVGSQFEYTPNSKKQPSTTVEEPNLSTK
jgi:cytochrome c oxidase assembly factor 5